MSSQQSKKCNASTQTPLDHPNNNEYTLTYSNKDSTVTLATAAMRVFTDGPVLPPLRKRIKYDMDYLIAVKAAETQRRRQARKISESSEQSTDSWFLLPKKKSKSKKSKQKTESTDDLSAQSSSNESTQQQSPTRKSLRPRQSREVDLTIEPAVATEYEAEITDTKEVDKAVSLTNCSIIKVDDIKLEPVDENTTELKEEEINENLHEEQSDTPLLINTKQSGKILEIENIVFQVKRPKILEKMSEEKALIIGKLLSEFKRHNMETRQQTSDEFFQNVKIVKSKLKQILRSGDQSLSETYAPRRDYYYL